MGDRKTMLTKEKLNDLFVSLAESCVPDPSIVSITRGKASGMIYLDVFDTSTDDLIGCDIAHYDLDLPNKRFRQIKPSEPHPWVWTELMDSTITAIKSVFLIEV